MNCPHCKTEFHFEASQEISYQKDNGKEKNTGYGFTTCFCPSCDNILLYKIEGIYVSSQYRSGIDEPYTSMELIYPQIGVRNILPDVVPNILSDDFSEASIVLKFSPKASAALSRRCLQNFLHSHLNIQERSLAKEIEKFVTTEKLPSYLLSAVDAIRNIGNFAAHPMKDTNTGEIVEVEDGEADWLLEVLEMLFDFYFVQPDKYNKRKDELNKKLEALGKPLMT